MFEKEAEEYSVGKAHEHYKYLFEEHAGRPVDFARWCFQDGAEFGYNKGRNEAKEILQVVLDKWKEERWILQSEDEVRKIETLMEQAEQFLKEQSCLRKNQRNMQLD